MFRSQRSDPPLGDWWRTKDCQCAAASLPCVAVFRRMPDTEWLGNGIKDPEQRRVTVKKGGGMNACQQVKRSHPQITGLPWFDILPQNSTGGEDGLPGPLGKSDEELSTWCWVFFLELTTWLGVLEQFQPPNNFPQSFVKDTDCRASNLEFLI